MRDLVFQGTVEVVVSPLLLATRACTAHTRVPHCDPRRVLVCCLFHLSGFLVGFRVLCLNLPEKPLDFLLLF